MKNAILILSVISLISCNKKKDKEYGCVCNIHSTTHTTVTKKVIAKSDGDAQSQCNDYGKSEAGSTGHYECNIQ